MKKLFKTIGLTAITLFIVLNMIVAADRLGLADASGIIQILGGGTGATTAQGARGNLGISYVVRYPVSGSLNPNDATTYWMQFDGVAPATSESHTSWALVTKAGTITKACVVTSSASGTQGSNENVTFLVRKNLVDTAMTWTDTWDQANNVANLGCTTSNGFTVAEGDILTIKITTPTWTTNPTANRSQAYFIIKEDQ